MKYLSVVPIYYAPEAEQMQALITRLADSFQLPVRVKAPWFDPETAFDHSRGQYHATLLLEQLLTEPGEQAYRLIALTGVDLFIPVLSYVFGEAQLEGRVGIASVFRLRPELYGLSQNNELLMERLHKEAVHELGHTFGLIHCLNSECVMSSSTYAEEIDIKSAQFCRECWSKVQTAMAESD